MTLMLTFDDNGKLLQIAGACKAHELLEDMRTLKQCLNESGSLNTRDEDWEL